VVIGTSSIFSPMRHSFAVTSAQNSTRRHVVLGSVPRKCWLRTDLEKPQAPFMVSFCSLRGVGLIRKIAPTIERLGGLYPGKENKYPKTRTCCRTRPHQPPNEGLFAGIRTCTFPAPEM